MNDLLGKTYHLKQLQSPAFQPMLGQERGVFCSVFFCLGGSLSQINIYIYIHPIYIYIYILFFFKLTTHLFSCSVFGWLSRFSTGKESFHEVDLPRAGKIIYMANTYR